MEQQHIRLDGKQKSRPRRPKTPQTLADVAGPTLRRIEHHVEAMRYWRGYLRRTMKDHPQFQAEWNAFITAGGVTAADLELFVSGIMEHREVTRTRHLRMIDFHTPEKNAQEK
jgi:hypothetical protein